MNSRSALVIAPDTGDGGVRSLLCASGWRVATPGSFDRIEASAERVGATVGIVVLSAEVPDDADRLIAALDRACGIEWIAAGERAAFDGIWARELILRHCFDHVTLPVRSESLLHVLGHAHGRAMMRRAGASPHESNRGEAGELLPGVVGESAALHKLSRQVRRIAAADGSSSILIRGDSGTGKELIARAIHALSERHAQAFCAVNCGALSASLVNAELFGHEKGAFTGAHQMRKGFIEAAAGGTIFLDEIGDLPLEQQTNLLRFLETRSISRVGSTHSIPVNVRVIAATHVDLEQAVKARRFREDLYYRLNVLPVTIPLLRQRPEDIVMLAQRFLCTFRTNSVGPVARGFSLGALRAMQEHEWPGNVRELKNRINRAMVLCEGNLITAEDLGLALAGGSSISSIRLDDARGTAERDAVRTSLIQAGNNVSRAARDLGVSRMTMYRLLAKYGVVVSGESAES